MSDSLVAGLVTNVDVGGRNWHPSGDNLTQAISSDEDANFDYVLLNATTPYSDKLQGKWYGFNIPILATIDGIEAYIHRDAISVNFYDQAIRVWKGSVSSNNKKVSSSWKTTNIVTYGGPTDLWGLTWTPEEINANNFKFTVKVVYTGSDTVDREADVNYHIMTIYWHINAIFGVSVSVCNNSLPTITTPISVLYGTTHLDFMAILQSSSVGLNQTIQVLTQIVGLLNMIPRIISPTQVMTNRPDRYIEYFWTKAKRSPGFKVPKSPYILED
jgi:hypothetical protein